MSAPTPAQIQYYEAHASDSLQNNIWISIGFGFALGYIAVGLRILARRQSKSGFGNDDYLIIAALVPETAYTIAGICNVKFGEGLHIIFVNNIPGFIEGYVTVITAYSITVVLTKLSILCLYCRIFPSKTLVRISYFFGAFIIAYDVALVLVAALECIPLSSLWTGEPGVCINTVTPFTVLGAVNVFTDFAILTLPIRFVLGLQMRLTRKIQICGIFLLGGLVCVFGLIRVIALATAEPGDESYNQVFSGIWSFCESSIGIVAACLPTLGHLFNRKRLSSAWSQARGLLTRSSGFSGTKLRRTQLDTAATVAAEGPGMAEKFSAKNSFENQEELPSVPRPSTSFTSSGSVPQVLDKIKVENEIV